MKLSDKAAENGCFLFELNNVKCGFCVAVKRKTYGGKAIDIVFGEARHAVGRKFKNTPVSPIYFDLFEAFWILN